MNLNLLVNEFIIIIKKCESIKISSSLSHYKRGLLEPNHIHENFNLRMRTTHKIIALSSKKGDVSRCEPQTQRFDIAKTF